MSAIGDLLARAALLKNPRIPADTVPCLVTHPDPTSPPDGFQILPGDLLALTTPPQSICAPCVKSP